MTDIEDVTQLILRERQARDRGWWDRMAACFASDSEVMLSWFRGTGTDFTRLSEQMSRSGIRAVHRMSPPIIQVNGDRAVAEAPAVIELRTMLDGVTVDLDSNTRLLYQLTRGRGSWQVQALTCIYERDTLMSAVPGTAPVLDTEALARFRAPFRYLAYVLTRTGQSVSADLFGDDQPDRLASLYATVFGWAGLPVG